MKLSDDWFDEVTVANSKHGFGQEFDSVIGQPRRERGRGDTVTGADKLRFDSVLFWA